MTGSLGPNGWLGPNFFVVGAMKAGTTAVYANLNAHPEVYCAPIKEPNFFSDDLEIDKFTSKNARAVSQFDTEAYVESSMDEPVHEAYVRNPTTYYALFRKAEGKRAIGECSTSYLYSTTAARNIRLAVPHARIIMILRDPVDRAISQYHMECRIGAARDRFGVLREKDLAAPRTAWGQSGLYVELGRYVGQVERYLAQFPREQVKIIVYDDLRADFRRVMADTLRFLGVDPELQPASILRANHARVPRAARFNYLLTRIGGKNLINRAFPQPAIELGKRIYYRKAGSAGVTEADRERLRALFADEVVALSRLLGRDLSHWRESPRQGRAAAAQSRVQQSV
jgi:hypothetical protein